MPEKTWADAAAIREQIRSTRQVGTAEFCNFYNELTRNEPPKVMELHQCNGWSRDWPSPNRGWTFANKVWAGQKQTVETNGEKLSKRWEQAATATESWSKVWGGLAFPKVRFFIWRLLHNGFFNNERASKWKVCNSICGRCSVTSSTTTTCSTAAVSARQMAGNPDAVKRYKDSNRLQDTFYGSIKVAVLIQKRNPGPLIFLSEICGAIWRERNAHAYSNFLGRLSGWVILLNTSIHLEAMMAASNSQRKTRQLQRSVEEIETY